MDSISELQMLKHCCEGLLEVGRASAPFGVPGSGSLPLETQLRLLHMFAVCELFVTSVAIANEGFVVLSS